MAELPKDEFPARSAFLFEQALQRQDRTPPAR
jgi:hypothetical protein